MLSPGAHRRRKRAHGRHRVRKRSAVRLPRLLIAASLLGTAAVFGTTALAPQVDPGVNKDLSLEFDDRAFAEDELSRSSERSPAPSSPSPSAIPSPTVKAMPAPVAGLSAVQMNNAAIIVEVARAMSLPREAMIIGVATAMQESDLHNNASEAVPESLKYPHEGTSVDHDSIGVFQQRPSSGWGTVANLMRPAYQAEKFFGKLIKLDWESMSLTEAAQAVQVSAYPGAYAKHESRATTVVDALL
ncbi:hypothetical protein Rhe02_76060 [Rhizocola hellebori]|uniref:Peptidase M23 n=1 Tax=Rhizocola hellebori TaxID=1392758 RepID=A0A8J3QES5_9ACTN|nr:hypothetical protein [Rhizocola hellebori]GIH09539.1 hypothetical protein Rhe02_76060 [Rhizocola hellebori]